MIKVLNNQIKKKLIIINGTMGVGKTETCKLLYKKLENSVWLDGDWCWMMNPFIPNEENIKMVEGNILHLLTNFLNNSSYEYVIFNWVIHKEEIFNIILNSLKGLDFDVYKITLMCSEESLKNRLHKDIENGIRKEEVLKESIQRLKMYQNMDTIKIDTTKVSVSEVVDKIISIIKNKVGRDF